ncbi:hypothetical protein WJX81_000223 [Elliptochloris bilobata]|uniref:Uncharacterized protein n=1 Tax=Elliptochloris bilobata TaxID=381761 RepID=A0AAW1S0H5_9CHLO
MPAPKTTSFVAFPEADHLEETKRRLDDQFNQVQELLRKGAEHQASTLHEVCAAAREQSGADYEMVAGRLQDMSGMLANLEAQMQAGAAARKASLAQVFTSLEGSVTYTLLRLHKERSAALEQLDALKPPTL